MTNAAPAALRPYEKILAKARKKLDIHTPFSLKAGDRWYFDVPHDRSSFTLTCPPFSSDTEPSFLHYLCHAHILDAGWLLPVTETKNISAKAFFYTVNRSIDHFFDYYAWLLVVEKFGVKYPLRVSAEVSSATSERIIRGLRIMREQYESPYPAFTTAMDWFSLFPTIASFVDKKREAQLISVFYSARAQDTFAEATLPGAAGRIGEIRAFFRELLRHYPRYDALLSSIPVFRKEYRAYYRIAWSGTGLRSRIKSFY